MIGRIKAERPNTSPKSSIYLSIDVKNFDLRPFVGRKSEKF